MLNEEQAIAKARLLKGYQDSERRQLDVLRRYWKGRQKLPAVIPTSSPRMVKTMARIARVNICPIVIDSLAQSTFAVGYRAKDEKTNSDVWQIWQKNKMDARQTGIHRAAYAYGAAYAVVLPGDPVPVIRGASPRSLTAMYGDDPDWPVYALERRPHGEWRLYDNQGVYFFSSEPKDRDAFTFYGVDEHGAGVTPVIRYLDEVDLDCDDEASAEMGDRSWEQTPTSGQIAPLMSIQDQIDLTTFGLLVAQWYTAFRQRYVIGWVPDDEAQRLKASASTLWTFEDAAEGAAAPGEGVKVGEFAQTDLDGYLASREASLRHAASLSQTPVHELTAQLVNLSAEALAAAENGHDRKVEERKTLLGESHEQTLQLAAKLGNMTVPGEDAQIIWRDTSARTFAATVDGLGKLVTMLKIPPEVLWERVPGVTQQDVEEWRKLVESSDSFSQLTELLANQAKTATPPALTA